MSSPILLVLNSDNCAHCLPLIEDRLFINELVSKHFPEMCCIWSHFNKMNFSVLPPKLRLFIDHVPIVLYFPRGTWDEYLNMNWLSPRVKILDVTELSKYSHDVIKYDVRSIMNWLCDVVEDGERSDDSRGDSSEMERSVQHPVNSITDWFYNVAEFDKEKYPLLISEINSTPDPVSDLLTNVNKRNDERADDTTILTCKLLYNGVLYTLEFDTMTQVLDVKIESDRIKVLMSLSLSD